MALLKNSLLLELHNKMELLKERIEALIEAARTMLQDVDLPTSFWAEDINTACYTQNRNLINKFVGNTPYIIMRGRKPTIKHLHVFGSKCYILKDNSEHIENFDSKALEAIFLGYSLERTTYRVYVIDHEKVMESMDVTLDDKNYHGTSDSEEKNPLAFENIEEESESEEETIKSETNSGNKSNQEKGKELLLENSPFERCNNSRGVSQETTVKPVNIFKNANSTSKETSHNRRWDREHTPEQIIGDPNAGIRTRSATQYECLYGCFLS